MQSKNNVQKFRIDSIGSKFNVFIKNKFNNSTHTANAYTNHINQFFEYMKGKNVNELIHIDADNSDILFTSIDIVEYRNDLIDGTVTGEPISPSTANSKISAIKSFYKFLSTGIRDIDLNIFNIGQLKTGRQNGSEDLAYEEAMEMSRLALKLKNGEEKSCMIELASYTSIRLEALLGIQLSDIKSIGRGGYVVDVIDKGQKFDDKPFREDLYQRLVSLNKDNNGILFSLDKRTFQRTIEQLAKQMGLSQERHITFHSLKNVAINWIIETGGSIVDASIQGNHKSIETTYRRYIKKKKNYFAMAGMLMGAKKDYSKLDSLSKEELLDIIKSCNDGIQVTILRKIEEKFR